MYLGEIVEIADTEELFRHPQHPYTKALLDAIPEPVPQLSRQRQALEGEVPSPVEPPSGCSFHPRCPEATRECRQTDPTLERVTGATEGNMASCLHVEEFTRHTGLGVDESVDARYSVERFDHAEDVAATDGGAAGDTGDPGR